MDPLRGATLRVLLSKLYEHGIRSLVPLLVPSAALSGHHATLLQGTIRAFDQAQQVVFGGRSQSFADYQNQRAVDYGLFRITDRALTSIIISVIVLVLVALMLQRTKIGKAMRAVSDNRDLAGGRVAGPQ